MKQAEVDLAQPLPLGLSMSPARARTSDYLALTKPRLNGLVVATTAVGFYLGSNETNVLKLAHTVVGTALVAGGASALNQLWERETDGLMTRTRTRPLPDGRLSPTEGGVFGLILSIGGLAQLAVGVNFIAALVALVTLLSYIVVYTPLKLRTSLSTLVSYVFVYTPLKTRTSLSTLVGAVPGALPPVIGWAAATGTISLPAAVLFGIVFLWQMPHFLAIAWMYRDDYRRAGFPLLPVIEPDGRSTGRQAALYAASLIPVSLLPGLVGLAGRWYVGGALLLGVALLAVGLTFACDRTSSRARSLFLASILYLPLLWGLMIADRVRL